MGKNIMVVDDAPDTIELVTALLEMNDLTPITFTMPQPALDTLKKGPLPDLLVLDMRMPEISGPDFCQELRKDKKFDALKIVFFTASSDLDRTLLEKYHVLGFIFKPFENDAFVRQIRHFCE